MGYSYSTTILHILLYLFFEIVFCSSIKVECIPDTPGIFLSSYKSYVTIYNFSENNQLSQENAAFFCTIEGRKDFVKLESIIYGEPPKSLFLEMENETYSMLHSKVVCSVSDIAAINHVIPESEVAFHNETFGDVTYKCGTQGLKFVLKGLQMLTRNLSHLVQLSGKTDDTKCLRNTESNGTHINLGKACAPRKRNMFDSDDELICCQCCAGYYWSVISNKCEECGPCGMRDEPNIRTSCSPTDCKTTAAPSTRSTNPTTFSTTTQIVKPTKTTVTSVPSISLSVIKPSETPQNFILQEKCNTSVILQWDRVTRASSYLVKIKRSEGGFDRYFESNETSNKLEGLIQGNYYTTAVCAKNSAGQGPWSGSITVRTLGTEPKRLPTNVEVDLKDDTVEIALDEINDRIVGEEEPIEGVKIKVILNGDVYLIRNENEMNFAKIHLSKDGNYIFQVYYYNSIGNGPAAIRTIEYQTDKGGEYSCGLVFFGGLLLAVTIFVLSCRCVYERVDNWIQSLNTSPPPGGISEGSPEGASLVRGADAVQVT